MTQATLAVRADVSLPTIRKLEKGDSTTSLEIAEAISCHGDPATIAADLAQLYRRVVYSILICNRDDHLRNHGFLRTAGGGDHRR